jgi:hypothetical protein
MTRNLQFFMRPAEFSALAWDLAERLQLDLILWHRRPVPSFHVLRPGENLCDSRTSARQQMFISKKGFDPELADPNHPYPARLGWVMCDLPQEVRNQLLLCQLGAKSHYLEPSTGETCENDESIRLFKQLASRIRKNLRYPVWARNIRTGGTAEYRSIGFSPGTEDWVRDGGELSQLDVDNVRFFLGPLVSSI